MFKFHHFYAFDCLLVISLNYLLIILFGLNFVYIILFIYFLNISAQLWRILERDIHI